MANSVQHLRGTKEEWRIHDPVIPDGEIALIMDENESYRLKIGNGKQTFSKLPYPSDEIIRIEGTEAELTLGDREEIRMGEMSFLKIAIPEQISESFISSIVFDSGETPTTIEYDTPKVKYSGVDIQAELFVPSEHTHYNVIFWYDGALQCTVRGVGNVD